MTDTPTAPFTEQDIARLLAAWITGDQATVQSIAGPLLQATTTAGALIETLAGTAAAQTREAMPGSSDTMRVSVMLERVGIDAAAVTGPSLITARLFEATAVADDHWRRIHTMTCLDDPMVAGDVVTDLLNLCASAWSLVNGNAADAEEAAGA